MPRELPDDVFVLGYVGSAGHLVSVDEVVVYFAELLCMRSYVRFLIVKWGEHAGIFFIKPIFPKQALAPTKLAAEFLGCGIPCLGNASAVSQQHNGTFRLTMALPGMPMFTDK